MSTADYVLGTHDAEIYRLGVQHRVWQPYVLESWRQAGIREGMRVLDVGAGPGLATRDLAEFVGPTGHVTAVEIADHFIEVGRRTMQLNDLSQVTYHQLNLETDPIPDSGYDLAWCRWVLCFLQNPEAAIRSVFDALKPGGMFVSHEYSNYVNWSLIPPDPALSKFVHLAIRDWEIRGGEPNIGQRLPSLLRAAGFEIVRADPMVFSMQPTDYAWNWPRLFVENQADRVALADDWTADDAEATKAAMRQATANPSSIMVSPVVMSLIARKPR